MDRHDFLRQQLKYQPTESTGAELAFSLQKRVKPLLMQKGPFDICEWSITGKNQSK